MHHHTNTGRVALFFEATGWSGEIVNREPDKCAGWAFIRTDQLPDNVVPCIADALRHLTLGLPYSERGWG